MIKLIHKLIKYDQKFNHYLTKIMLQDLIKIKIY